MIRINLLAVREAEASQARRSELIIVGGLAALVLAYLGMTYLSQSRHLRSAEDAVAEAERTLAQIRVQNQAFDRMQQQKKEIEEKLKIVQSLTAPSRRAAPVHILDDLSESVPEYLWLTDFTEVGGTVRMNGRAVDNQTIASFANNLKEKSRYFYNIEIRETAQEEITFTPPAQRGRTQTRTPAAPTPAVPLKKFFIEAAINYQPDAESEPQQETSDNQKSQGKRPGAAPSTSTSGGGKE